MKNNHYKDFCNQYTRGRAPKAPSAEELSTALAVIMAALHVDAAIMKSTSAELDKMDDKTKLYSLDHTNSDNVFIGKRAEPKEFEAVLRSVAIELGDELFEAIKKEPLFLLSSDAKATLGITKEIIKARKIKGEDTGAQAIMEHVHNSVMSMVASMGGAIAENVQTLCSTSLMFIRHGMEYRNERISQPVFTFSGEFFFAYLRSRVQAITGYELSPMAVIRDFCVSKTGLEDVIVSITLKAFVYAVSRYNEEVKPL